MTKDNKNATEFIVWGESEDEVKRLFERGIKDVISDLVNYMEGDLKEGLELTNSIILTNSFFNLGELLV